MFHSQGFLDKCLSFPTVFTSFQRPVLEIGGTTRQSLYKKPPNRGEDEDMTKDKKQ